MKSFSFSILDFYVSRARPLNPFVIGFDLLNFNGYCLLSIWKGKCSYVEFFGIRLYEW